jgi:hypothetical protein
MNIEKIKFGDYIFDLVPNGINLTNEGGKITFQEGEKSFDEIKAILKFNNSITLIGLSGNPEWNRDDLVYAGKLTEQENFVISSENIQTDIDKESGELIYETHEIRKTVIIAEFRTPDLRDEVAALNARVAYLSMMSKVDFGEV